MISTRLNQNQAIEIVKHVARIKNNIPVYISLKLSDDNSGYLLLISRNSKVETAVIDELVASAVRYARKDLALIIDSKSNFAFEDYESRQAPKNTTGQSIAAIRAFDDPRRGL